MDKAVYQPFLKQGGGYVGWNLLTHYHFNVLGGTGSYKTGTCKLILACLALQTKHTCLMIGDPKGDDFLFANTSPNTFLGSDAHKVIDAAFDEFQKRKANPHRKRVYLIVYIDELVSMFEEFEDKKTKDSYKKKLRLLLFQGRSLNIRLLISTQVLMAEVLGGDARAQFSGFLNLGHLKSSVAKSMFDLEDGQTLEKSLPAGYGWLQWDGQPIQKIKVRHVRDFNNVHRAILNMLKRPLPDD
ncbi:type IV secretory system conjugative DNA transfer family protein [Streptococcus entericus]|uniref:type IV secretory system conjugative DNA transfer family protein n=1 Tax=Streptococcus entericus TaxID=155680 RepID=UPI000364BE69|nr:type IV secretory system conjugative DNA transfer family protein [Streptococcus entericus]